MGQVLLECPARDVADLSHVMTVMEAAFPKRYGEGWNEQQLRSTLALPNSFLAVARKCERTIAFILTREVVDEMEILLIAVHPDERGRGIGRLMLQAVFDRATKCGKEKVFLEVRRGNVAELLYKNMGFQQIGLRKNYYRSVDGELHDAITMAWGG